MWAADATKDDIARVHNKIILQNADDFREILRILRIN